MTIDEAIRYLSVHSSTNGSGLCTDEQHYEAKQMAIKALEQEPNGDCISREAIKKDLKNCMVTEIRDEDDDLVGYYNADTVDSIVRNLPPVNPQEPTGQYEKHIDHTDCIWYGSDGGCPVTCSQYRDGWNDAMDYIYKGGKGYQPYRREWAESENKE